MLLTLIEYGVLVINKVVDVYYKRLQIKTDCCLKEVRKTCTLVFRFMTYETWSTIFVAKRFSWILAVVHSNGNCVQGDL